MIVVCGQSPSFLMMHTPVQGLREIENRADSPNHLYHLSPVGVISHRRGNLDPRHPGFQIIDGVVQDARQGSLFEPRG